MGLPSIRRMPMYYRLLARELEAGRTQISSAYIAEALGMEPIVVRKDFTLFGIIGKPKIGYETEEALQVIDSLMNSRDSNEAFLVGVGNLGQALLSYRGFEHMGLDLIAGFDVDSDIVGRRIQGREIFALVELPRLAKRLHVKTGILCVPEEAAQDCADAMVDAGIEGIWNFAPVRLQVPDYVVVQNEDLAEGLAILIVKLNQSKREGIQRTN